jgi:hypothetical protein
MMVSDAIHWKDHILICTESYDLFEFICTLRSSALTSLEFKRVLIINKYKPTEEEFFMLRQFPEVYFIIGNPRNSRTDLIRAGIESADKVVIMKMSSRSANRTDSEYADCNAIMASHSIYSMFQGSNKKYVIHDLRKLFLLQFNI